MICPMRILELPFRKLSYSTNTALKETIAALADGGGGGGRTVRGLKIFQVCLAVSAADLFDVKANVGGGVLHHGTQQVAPEFFACRAG